MRSNLVRIRAIFSSAARYAVLAALLALAVPLVAGIVANAPAFAGTTFTVNSTADTDDGNCNAAPDCTLREAINAANSNAGADTIAFNIAGGGPYVIQPAAQLPAITEAVLIDGASQTGYAGTPVIVLDGRTGAGGPAGANGLVITASNSEIRALEIKNWDNHGINVSGASADSNWLHGNVIHDNAASGIRLGSGASGNTIGTNGDATSDAAERNVIGDNGDAGIIIQNSGSDGNVVAGNYIGTNAAGDSANGNAHFGVAVSGGAQNNRIGTNGDGTADTAERNVISGNGSGLDYLGHGGILITGANTDSTIIAGNYVGVAADGATAISNDTFGITILAGPKYTLIGTDADGTADASERNVVSGNVYVNILIQGIYLGVGTDNNIVAGNYVGLDASGTTAVRTTTDAGIAVQYNAEYNRIGTNGDGSNDSAERNVVSGHSEAMGGTGIAVAGDEASNNTVAGNYIGTDATGTAAVPNNVGIVLGYSATYNLVGTNADASNDVAEGNLVSGNVYYGIMVHWATTSNNTVAGNIVGLDATGTVPVGSQHFGIVLGSPEWYAPGPTYNLVGGTAPTAGNLISGNQYGGMPLFDADNNTLQGNQIGGTISVDLGVAPWIGNYTAIWMSGSSNNTIGGASAGAGNIMIHNTNDAVVVGTPNGFLFDPVSDNNIFQGNFIGTDGTTNGLGQYNFESVTPYGISITKGNDNLIGGTGAGEGNVILSGFEPTIAVVAGTGNSFLSNHIMNSIDLNDDGITANDNLDADSGPNNLQNYPVINSFAVGETDGAVSGSLHAEANATYTVQVYFNFDLYNPGYGRFFPCSFEVNGPAQNLVATETVNTDGSGNGTFGGTYSLPFPEVTSVTAIATDANGNSSEISPCLTTRGPVIWVSTDNTTAPFYGTFADPFQTISDALTFAAGSGYPGAIIMIRPGTYVEQVSLPMDNLTLIGMNGTSSTTVCSSTMPVFDNNGHTGISIKGLTLSICP